MRLPAWVVIMVLAGIPCSAQGALASTGVLGQSPAGSRKGDSLWNGILIGVALGVLATLTTAAEAPPSGKVTTVLSLAALGGFVDSRMQIDRPFVPVRSQLPGWRLRVMRSIRF